MKAFYFAVCLLILGSVGCAGIKGDLEYAQSNYNNAQYEKALAWLVELEPKMGEMDGPMRAQYQFLRGMTEYHFERHQHALHFLSLANATVQQEMSGGEPEWYPVLTRTLLLLTPTEKVHFARKPEIKVPVDTQLSVQENKKEGDPFVRP